MEKKAYLLLALALSSSSVFAARTTPGVADSICTAMGGTQYYWASGDLDIDLITSGEKELVTTFTSQQPNLFHDIIYTNVGNNEAFKESMIEAIKSDKTMLGCVGESGEIYSLVIQGKKG